MLGCANAHDLPRFLWHVKHAAALWPDGRAWQFWHELEFGCVHVVAANATDGL